MQCLCRLISRSSTSHVPTPWRQQHLARTLSTPANNPGLFGIPRLQTQGDFPRWAEDAKDRCNELVQHIIAAPPDASVVAMVDDISDTICQVYDSAECVRNIHPDASWRQAATTACQSLSTYLAEINHHEGLYNKLLEVTAAYSRSAAAAAGGGGGGSSSGPQHVAGSHSQQQQQADPRKLGSVKVSTGGRSPWGGGGSVVSLDAGNIHHYLATSEHEEGRRQVYMTGAQGPAENLALLDHMLSARHQMGTLLGFRSYAAFKAADGTLAGTPDAAEAFLVALAEGCRDQADEEVAGLTQLKRKHTGHSDGSYQQPILCLVGNLSASSGARGDDATRLLLTWREFRTLLHEMGHAVHSLVSRTRYQHVWGTRCSQDLVEVPSHLWEHFSASPKSLALLARHKGSREPMPSKLTDELCKGWSSFSSVTPGLELQQQALLSLIDLRYHGPVLPQDQGGSSSIWHSLAQQYSSLPPAPDTCPQARFSHLTIYGACYYSYLYARCISEALWNVHLAADPLDPAAGRHLRQTLLQPGGSIDPLELLTAAFGGQEATSHVLVQQQQSGWSPNPASLLHSSSTSARVLVTA